MEGQISIFDLLPREGFCENQTINELYSDLKKMFPHISEPSYGVWLHVPNLGKRFEAYIRPFGKAEGVNLTELIDKYKAKKLEVTFTVMARPSDGGLDAMVSTLWLTQGRMEM